MWLSFGFNFILVVYSLSIQIYELKAHRILNYNLKVKVKKIIEFFSHLPINSPIIKTDFILLLNYNFYYYLYKNQFIYYLNYIFIFKNIYILFFSLSLFLSLSLLLLLSHSLLDCASPSATRYQHRPLNLHCAPFSISNPPPHTTYIKSKQQL